jgi:hypothetical protein
MNPLSPFMRETRDKYRTLSSIQAIFARFDEVLFLDYLNIPGRFDDVKLAQIGHCNLFMGPAGIECITELIEAEEAKDPKPVMRKNEKTAGSARSAKKSATRAQEQKTKGHPVARNKRRSSG